MLNRIHSMARRLAVSVWAGLTLCSAGLAAETLAPGEVKVLSVNESMSPRNAAFQSCAGGLPAGQTVAVGVDRSVSRTGMVRFDGQSSDGTLLIEAKGYGYKIDEKTGAWKDGQVSTKMQQKVRAQVARQLEAAKLAGRRLEWRVPNAGIQRAFQSLLGAAVPVTVAGASAGCASAEGPADGGTSSF